MVSSAKALYRRLNEEMAVAIRLITTVGKLVVGYGLEVTNVVSVNFLPFRDSLRKMLIITGNQFFVVYFVGSHI